jgi:Sec7-like guanine-nucleotide exchange factor
MLSEKYSPLITDNSQKQEVERYTEIKEVFEAELERILVELFDDKVPFSQVEDVEMCKYCDFKKICRR